MQSSTKELKTNFISKQGTDVMIDFGEDLEVLSASISQSNVDSSHPKASSEFFHHGPSQLAYFRVSKICPGLSNNFFPWKKAAGH